MVTSVGHEALSHVMMGGKMAVMTAVGFAHNLSRNTFATGKHDTHR